MRRVTLSLCVMLMLTLAACSSDEDKPSAGQANETENQNTNEVYPLTGTEAENNVNKRAVGVMINNHPKARPQTGLDKADIVFEILAEGSITRFLALYQSEEPDVAGPVRSAREYYFELSRGYNAIYTYHGAANFVNDMIEDRGIEYVDGALHDNDGRIFTRSQERSAPHNSYVHFDGLYNYADEKGYSITESYDPLPFNEDETGDQTGESAEKVTIDYSEARKHTVQYTYNSNQDVYTRHTNGEQTVEHDSGESITMDNILVMETPHSVIDSEGRRDIDMSSGGDGYLIKNGTVQEVQWENRDGRIIPMQDGDPVPFTPGKTWINVIPTDPGLSQAVTVGNE